MLQTEGRCGYPEKSSTQCVITGSRTEVLLKSSLLRHQLRHKNILERKVKYDIVYVKSESMVCKNSGFPLLICGGYVPDKF